MRSELRCSDVRPELSALLDGELDAIKARSLREHMEGCASCRGAYAELAHVRQLLRVQSSEDVPDLVAPIMARVRTEPRRWTWQPQVRTAAIAAMAAALVVLATSLPWQGTPRSSASADEIVAGVRAAAGELAAYRARFDVTEHGWHPEVPARSFEARVSFAAPERFRLSVEDATDYPAPGWPHNDVRLVANPNRWTIHEPSTCPTEALPACAAGAPTEDRTVIERQPFDANSRLPTDIAVPLETLSDKGAVQVLEPAHFLDRTVQRVVLPYRAAMPLIGSLQVGGSWRPFHPADEVEIWIDDSTWFPLRFLVRAGSSPDRQLWAERNSIPTEEAGTVLFEAAATAFAEPDSIPSKVFKARVTGAVQEGGFMPISFAELEDLDFDVPSDLEEYRAGVTPQGQTIASFARGMTYLKITSAERSGLAHVFAGPAEVIALGSAGEGLYEPAGTDAGRTMQLVEQDRLLAIESNLPRSALIEVAGSLDIRSRLPEKVRTGAGTVVQRIEDASDLPFAQEPSWIPEGYERTSVLLSRSNTGPTVTIYFRRPETSFEGFGIRIVQSRGISRLTPSAEEFVNVKVDGEIGRFSFERAELEWVENDIYTAVAVPEGDLSTALRIARSLR